MKGIDSEKGGRDESDRFVIERFSDEVEESDRYRPHGRHRIAADQKKRIHVSDDLRREIHGAAEEIGQISDDEIDAVFDRQYILKSFFVPSVRVKFSRSDPERFEHLIIFIRILGVVQAVIPQNGAEEQNRQKNFDRRIITDIIDCVVSLYPDRRQNRILISREARNVRSHRNPLIALRYFIQIRHPSFHEVRSSFLPPALIYSTPPRMLTETTMANHKRERLSASSCVAPIIVKSSTKAPSLTPKPERERGNIEAVVVRG
ncbi:MAG: hypothetical protein MPW14_22345 [Candidatus Manganitrophus sp.]|nr:MAG: hypothetical protein MPW14_22345 [Candidatus Manganitrophus sp.]